MTKRETSADINDEAAAWAARVDRGELPPAEAAALDAWLAADPRRAGAYARARAVSAHFDRARALGSNFSSEQTQPARSKRARTLWVGAVATAASVAAIAVLLTIRSPDIETRRGEVRVVPLADGSAMTLNTATRVDIDYDAAYRRVELLEGEALFNVAKDPRRPFIVNAAGTQVRAVGTSFVVRRMPDESVQVLVNEGVVEVVRSGSAGVRPVRLAANTRAYSNPDQQVQAVPVPPAQVAREIAWQEGVISFNGMTLRQAAEEYARYSDTRIIIDDPAVGDQTITGLFSANDPVGFAKAIGTSMELRVEIERDGVHLSAY